MAVTGATKPIRRPLGAARAMSGTMQGQYLAGQLNTLEDLDCLGLALILGVGKQLA